MADYGLVIESLYNRFLLRDFFGKIIPGSILIIIITSALIDYNDFWKFLNYLKEIWLWIFFIGISWIIGFTIQSIGEIIPFRNIKLRYYPESYIINDKQINLDDNKWFNMYLYFKNEASDKENQEFERFVVIKEACGNGYIAFLIILIIIIINIVFAFFQKYSLLSSYIRHHPVESIFIIASTIIVIISLRLMHTRHVQRQFYVVRNSEKMKDYFKNIYEALKTVPIRKEK